MATTPTKWNALSIHERIRAMNETLDSVESSQGGEDATIRMIVPAADPSPKRSSVVDIWRQREAKGETSSAIEDRPNLPVRKEAPTSNFFSLSAGTNARPVSKEESPVRTDQHSDDTVRPRMARQPASSRGIASASPAPPPLPMRRGGTEQQQTDITIVPSPSNQSSASSTSSRRSTRVLQAWERKKEGELANCVDVGQRTVPKTPPEESKRTESIIITETPSRRSVVDIWQNKASSPKASNSWIKKPPAIPRSPKTATTTVKQPQQVQTNKPDSAPKWRAALKSTSPSNQSEETKAEPEPSANRWTQLKKVEPTVPKWKVPHKPVAEPPRWKTAMKEAQTKESQQRSVEQKEQQRAIAQEQHVAENSAGEILSQQEDATAARNVKGSVLDRWKVAQTAPTPPVPQWKKKVKPPVEHVVVQDEPTASETEMPSDDELVDFVPQEASTMVETSNESVAPKKPGKITDRWLHANGVSPSKPPAWTKPNLKPIKSLTKTPKQELTNVTERTTPKNNSGDFKRQGVEGKGVSSVPQSPKLIEKIEDQVHNEQQSVPAAIQCDSPPAQTTASSLKITPPSPIVSKLVKEFGHRTPIAGLRKVDRTMSHENKGMGVANDSSVPENLPTETPVTESHSNVPTTPSENHSVPDHLSGLVRNLGCQTPSGKKRLSIAERWTAKVSASKSNSASKIDVSNEDQPTDEEEDVAGVGQDAVADLPLLSHSAEASVDRKDSEIVADDVQGTPTSVRSGVADRWKRRVATSKETTTEIPPQSSSKIELSDTLQSSTKASPLLSSAKVKSPINLLSAPSSTHKESAGNLEPQSCQDGGMLADDSGLLQELSFSSDAQSNHESSDVEIVLNASSTNTRAETPNLLPQPGHEDEIVEEEKNNGETGTALSKKPRTPSLSERRGRQLSRHRAQKAHNHSSEIKSEGGSSGRYPDFQKLVDRSRKLSSSLSPTRETHENCLPPTTTETPSTVTTPPRIQKPSRSTLSRNRPFKSTHTSDSSPIDMITEWNQKLTATNGAGAETAAVMKTSSPPRATAQLINTQESIAHRRNRKNFAQLGRKHAAKRPQIAGSHDEDSLDEELTQQLVQNEEPNRPRHTGSLSPSKFLSSREFQSVAPLDSRKYSATPVMSNRRRSSSTSKRGGDTFERHPIAIGSETSASTRKLASEKSLIKKKLNSRRKSRDIGGSTAGFGPVPLTSSTGIAPVADASNNGSFVQKPSYDHGEDYDAILLPDSGSSIARDKDYDQALVAAASSGSSPSSLANKAERVLQERRRKAQNSDIKCKADTHSKSQNNDMEEFANRVREGIPSQDKGTEAARQKIVRGSDDLSSHGARSLSSRYNVSSRFMDQGSEVSMASESMQLPGSNDEESSFMMSTTSTNASPPLAPSGTRKSKQTSTSKQRRDRQKASDGSVTSSVNTANLSAWDASRVSDIASLMSIDLKKFANAVDERVAVLRDFVGGPTLDRDPSQPPQELDMEMEDVAIEVEYVEEDGDDLSNPPSELGVLSLRKW